MSVRVLVVDADQGIVESTQGRIASLGHDADFAHCQEQARRLFDRTRYAYCLVNWDLPAFFDGGVRGFQTFLNFLDEINPPRSTPLVPVIGMTDRGADTAEFMAWALSKTIWLRERGVAAFIPKPFPTFGTTLEQVVKDALAGRPPSLASACEEAVRGDETANPLWAAGVEPPKPFTGGEIVIYPGRAELLGVKIISDMGTGQALMILRALNERRADGRWRSFSSQDLAQMIGADEDAVRGCIRTIRVNSAERLPENAGVTCGLQDVIQNDGIQGYCLTPWIKVRIVEDCRAGSRGPDDPRNDPAPDTDGSALGPDDPENASDGPGNVPDGPRNVPAPGSGGSTCDPDGSALGPDGRCQWVLAKLVKKTLRRDEIIRGLKCSAKTAQRVINALKRQGQIEFVGSTKSGHYRLTGQAD